MFALTCEKCGGNHPGECKTGKNLCFNCGKEGHFAKRCPTRISTDTEQECNYPQETQLQVKQARFKGPTNTHRMTKRPWKQTKEPPP